MRVAEIGDAPFLAELEAEARTALMEQRGGAAVLAEEPAVDDWPELVERRDVRVFVATIDDVPVGYLELHLGTPIAVVRQVYVHADAREVGFGDELIAAAIAAATDAGADVIESFALPGDRQTKNLFERAGMTARKLIVSKRLSSDVP